MLASKLFSPTLRETPADAEVVSHQYMLRAGFIRKMAGGIYTYLPLAWKTLRKIETIVREEMNKAGGQEILMPIIQPSEMWEETGRWKVYGDEMFRLKDRHGRNYCLAPTHEELVTTLVKGDVNSYRQLPLLLYQVQNKYRDERRPRYGLMRGREFIMKDAYSFDIDEAGLDIHYQSMYDAYSNIFTRCGLSFRPVEADGGAIGGSNTHEFMVLADSGEADIVHCPSCTYASNVESAKPAVVIAPKEEMKELIVVDTPEAKTIEAVATFLGLSLDKTIKAVVYKADDLVVLSIVRGDHSVNEVAVQHLVNSSLELEMAEAEDLEKFGLTAGFISPVGLSQKDGFAIVVDESVLHMYNCVGGANKVDAHYANINPKRDFNLDDILVGSIRLIGENECCPECGATLLSSKGIEVGQVFKLGTKYSESLGATFLDQNGRPTPMIMGCYGIGVSRTMAAAIEQSHDEDGIIWPVSIAPYEVVIVPINAKDDVLMEISTSIYNKLLDEKIDVLLDDRKERAGVKFKDADLIGYPLRITISKATAETNDVEIRVRKSKEVIVVPMNEITKTVGDLLLNL